MDIATLRKEWNGILQHVEPASAKMSLKNGQLHSVEGYTVVIRFSSSFHRDKASAPEGSRNLEELLQKKFNQPLRIKCVLDSDVHAPPPIAKEENVDLASAAMDVF